MRAAAAASTPAATAEAAAAAAETAADTSIMRLPSSRCGHLVSIVAECRCSAIVLAVVSNLGAGGRAHRSPLPMR